MSGHRTGLHFSGPSLVAGAEARPSSGLVSQNDLKFSLQGVGTFQFERSSNSLESLQGNSLQCRYDLLSVKATENHAGDMSQVLGNSANSGSSYTTGENSVLSGNSNLRQNMSMNTDSVTSSGAASTGLPASPLSFTSSNVSFPGSSGLGSSSLLQPAGTSFTMLESQQDPNTRPTKLLKFAHVPLSNLGHQSVLLQRFPDVEDLEKHTSQPHDVHNVGLFHQTMNSNLTGKSSGMRPQIGRAHV